MSHTIENVVVLGSSVVRFGLLYQQQVYLSVIGTFLASDFLVVFLANKKILVFFEGLNRSIFRKIISGL